jgi:DNA-binding transcriptional MerR regulator
MCVDCDSPFMTIDETAELLRVHRRTLDNHRWKQTGPPYRRHGGRILYHREEVLRWSEQHRPGPRPF